MQPLPDAILRDGDRLMLSDTAENLKKLSAHLGAQLYAGDARVDEDHPLLANDQQLAEVVVTQGSPPVGTSLATSRFADRYQLLTLALHRTGWQREALRSGVHDIRLRIGDVILIQERARADRRCAAWVTRERETVLDATADLPTTRRAPALAIMAAIVLSSARRPDADRVQCADRVCC